MRAKKTGTKRHRRKEKTSENMRKREKANMSAQVLKTTSQSMTEAHLSKRSSKQIIHIKSSIFP